jgi:hypothetical protein
MVFALDISNIFKLIINAANIGKFSTKLACASFDLFAHSAASGGLSGYPAVSIRPLFKILSAIYGSHSIAHNPALKTKYKISWGINLLLNIIIKINNYLKGY